MSRPLRLAWFSPLPPDGSGIAAYSAELLPLLGRGFDVDTFTARNAHDFVWRRRQSPYDLAVYQLGNAAWHDYIWAYAAIDPGLIVLHDARLHHARARQLLASKRFDDYRAEFRFGHPDAPQGFAEYAVEGLGGPVYYLWRMIAPLMRTARGVAVHNARVAADLRAEFPGVPVDTLRMGVPPIVTDQAAGVATRDAWHIARDAFVVLAFGKVTAEKRIVPALRAAARVANAHVLIVGDAAGYETLDREIADAGMGGRVTRMGAVPDSELPRCLAAADACLCLRWPTAEETSASWLRCLAAGRATIISDLPHLVDIPTLLARGWTCSHEREAAVAIAVDVIEEDESLTAAIERLATDAALREQIAAAGHAYWHAHHRLELMAEDYRALLADVASRPVPHPPGLPSHFTDDYSSRARAIAEQFGVNLDILNVAGEQSG